MDDGNIPAGFRSPRNTLRNFLGEALLEETAPDEWKIRLDPDLAGRLLDTALKPGFAYRKADGSIQWSKIGSAFRNRHMDIQRIRTYAVKMDTIGRDGTLEWKDRITDIGISPDGILSMGFHTCLATILSDTVHEFRLLVDFTEEERNAEGTGRKQEFGDILTYYDIPEARSAASVLQLLTNHRRTKAALSNFTAGGFRSTTSELLEIVESPQMELINEAVTYSQRLNRKFSSPGRGRRRSALAPAVTGLLYVEWMEQEPVKAKEFFSGLETGENISGIVLVLRDRLTAIAAGNGTPQDGMLGAPARTVFLFGASWKHYLKGTSPRNILIKKKPAPIWCPVHRPNVIPVTEIEEDE